jgi:hypothetical protein
MADKIPLLPYLYIFVPILLLVLYKVYFLARIAFEDRPLIRCFKESEGGAPDTLNVSKQILSAGDFTLRSIGERGYFQLTLDGVTTDAITLPPTASSVKEALTGALPVQAAQVTMDSGTQILQVTHASPAIVQASYVIYGGRAWNGAIELQTDWSCASPGTEALCQNCFDNKMYEWKIECAATEGTVTLVSYNNECRHEITLNHDDNADSVKTKLASLAMDSCPDFWIGSDGRTHASSCPDSRAIVVNPEFDNMCTANGNEFHLFISTGSLHVYRNDLINPRDSQNNDDAITLSLFDTYTPKEVTTNRGCTDSRAENYDSAAEVDDSSCQIRG